MKSIIPFKLCCASMIYVLEDECSSFEYNEFNFVIKNEKYTGWWIFRERTSWNTIYLKFCPFCGYELKKLLPINQEQ